MRDYISILVTLIIAGCTTPSKTERAEYKLVQAGDCLIIQSITRPAPEIRTVVGSDGCIDAPFAGKLRVAGLTLVRVARALEDRYQPTELPELKLSVTRCSD